jgi:hypothetical protein
MYPHHDNSRGSHPELQLLKIHMVLIFYSKISFYFLVEVDDFLTIITISFLFDSSDQSNLMTTSIQGLEMNALKN